MKVAVTGGSGFLGQHVVRRLLDHPGVDRVIIGTRHSLPATDIAARAEQVELDISTAGHDAYDRMHRPDVLVHLAWAGLPNYRSLHHFESELPRQYAFLKHCLQEGLGSLLVTGTCYEYGMTAGECDESIIAAPTNPYAYAKQALLAQLEMLRAHHPFEFSWARLFYTYGPGQAPTSLIPQLLAAIARGEPRFAMSAGEQLRDYLPVEQVADILVNLALRGPGAGVVNVCSGRPQSVRGLVESILQARGLTIELDRGKYPYPDYEPFAFWGSRIKLDALLATRSPV